MDGGCPACGAGTLRTLGRSDESAETLAYRIGAAARRPASWLQLVKFGLVGGSGYLINLAVFAVLAGNLGVHHVDRRGRRLLRRRHQQLPLEPLLDLRRRRGPRRLPGGALLRRQRRLAADQPGRARGARRGTVLGDLTAQAIAVAIAMPFNFLGNKLWTFA